MLKHIQSESSDDDLNKEPTTVEDQKKTTDKKTKKKNRKRRSPLRIGFQLSKENNIRYAHFMEKNNSKVDANLGG